MTLNATIASQAQKSAAGDLIELFIIDATVIGGSVLRYTPGTLNGAAVTHDSHTYLPMPIETSGFSWSSAGSPPQPTMRVSNINQTFVSILIQQDDLVGTKVIRLRTFRAQLSDGDGIFPKEIWRIERKSAQTKEYIEWQLAAPFDQADVQIPKRQVLRDTCTHTYRRWDADATPPAFDYSGVSCPYTGTSYFTPSGVIASSAQDDACGKRLRDCRLRYGNDALPIRAFPGVARIR